MRKSIWLLSAGLAAFSAPAVAQDTTDQPSTPAEAPLEAASVDTADQAAEADDQGAITGTHAAAQHLRNPERLRFVAVEDFIDAAAGHADQAMRTWASAFDRRYVPRPDSLPPT